MYESYYGFHEKPFTTLPDPEFLYFSSQHELAFTYLEYGLSSQAGFIVLTGEIGSGKTTLLHYLIDKLDPRTAAIAFIFTTNLSSYDFLIAVAREWGIEHEQSDKAALYDAINTFLVDQYAKRKQAILIIDEAQNLPFETLEEVRMLSNLNDTKRPLLHLILSGQPNLIHRLNNPKLEQLRQRISVHYHINPLDREETEHYIKHRLTKASAQNNEIFTSDAFDRIYEYSQGIPRLINLICDLSLVYGYAEQIRSVDGRIVDMVVQDRKRMGLHFGAMMQVPDVSGENCLDNDTVQTAVWSKKYRELCENVYELARLVKKLLEIRDDVSRHQQELQQIYQKIRKLEARCLAICTNKASRLSSSENRISEGEKYDMQAHGMTGTMP
ncbi:MAG: XrtA-associated ATPase [Desulfobacterota bacterium]|nr:XrtA-associated ATPase [Thermodesulfobacteriota bacterium]